MTQDRVDRRQPTADSRQPTAESFSSGGFLPEGHGAAALRVLEAIADLLSRQRAAILARDGRALNRLFEALLAPMEDLAVIAGLAGGPQPGPEEGSADALPALARHVYEQLAINRALIHNGMTITDHYVAAVSEAAASAHQALFSGVG
jgi:hypothetical protein